MRTTLIAVALLASAAACSDSATPTAPLPEGAAADRVHGTAPSSIELTMVAEGLTQPVALTHANDNTGRLFVVDQIGQIRIIDRDGTLRAEPFLDIRGKMVPLNRFYDERGLLGLAFHPKYKENGRFYVYYSAPLRPGAPAGYNVTSTISEFRVSSDRNRADPASERILLQVDKPQGNHNGGTIAFGPKDDFLYISIGDGGGANDIGRGHVEDWYPANAGGNGQDVTQNLLGNLLRIDVDRREGGKQYGIPRSNPFVGRDGLDEIYAYGFRNPWRFAFDPKGDHDLIAGDAGQSRWEEVDLVRRGGNYGWNVKEGSHCFNAANAFVEPASCPSAMPDGTPLIDPVIEYPNAAQGANGVGVTVVGGVVYRGNDVEDLNGRYIYGDWSRTFVGPPTGQLFIATPMGQSSWPTQKLRIASNPDGELHHRVLGFGQDRHGEVYVLTTDNVGPTGTTGKVFRISGPKDDDD
ncbi:MAG TPA: PQQ-dependent sugar dehydrogenase [Gemmatimonadaceae bacterium]|nr:PQQ-dependent sugar dehydrogenase [Gemmatimonadaceae bacterium]